MYLVLALDKAFGGALWYKSDCFLALPIVSLFSFIFFKVKNFFSITIDIECYIRFRCTPQWLDIYVMPLRV